jgi:TctA family transporter
MNPAKATAVRLIVEAVAVLVVVVVVVAKYEAEISAINWRLVSLVCVVAVALFGVYRWQIREDNTYDVLQMLTKDGRADLSAHLIVVFAGLSVWVVVQQALAKQPVTDLLLGILGIFVGGKALGGFSDAMQNRPPAIDQSRDVNILPGATVQQSPPPAGKP